MQRRDVVLLVLILVIVAVTAWIDWPTNPGLHIKLGSLQIDREFKVRQGLDLQGGMNVILEADLAPGETVSADAMEAAKGIIESRVNGLGVTEPNVQAVGTTRISVELPGIADPEMAIATFRQTGLLEFVDASFTPLLVGTQIKTSYKEAGILGEMPTPTAQPTVEPTATAAGVTATASPEPTAAPQPQEMIYPTILTGRHLQSAEIGFDERGRPEIDLVFNDEGSAIFKEYTSQSIGKYLAIAMDQTIISSPQIQSAIPDGQARITGDFTLDTVRSIVLQLKYGALPVPLKIIEQRSVGATLGQDSVQRSIRAGTIGLVIVLIFMLAYYRLPGLVADLALLIYALITFALFKAIPVTLTLPGIAGFLLSVGTAVDANILIFERIKEELRRGRTLGRAIEAGFDRAWTAIWDSNLAVFITCAVLWVFGNTLGASIVKGFAVTLFLGVAVSMFSAITITRTFLRTVYHLSGESLLNKKWLLGI
ncbi:MAG: protein translocase subunit SecD [Chloroflexi bacterium]|nr:protein translocase subunit SecD [Chloroflexota bacterium]